jgi:hypothetical protein
VVVGRVPDISIKPGSSAAEFTLNRMQNLPGAVFTAQGMHVREKTVRDRLTVPDWIVFVHCY